MAITPASISTLSANELATISFAETAIDAELRLKFESGKAVAIRNVLIRDVLDLNPNCLVELKSRYTSAGWTVVEYESPEGTWLSFSET